MQLTPREETESRIVFISVPESLRASLSDGFPVDPSIPIPVELPPGETKLDLEQLSWEMMLSGMMRVISETGPQMNVVDADADAVADAAAAAAAHGVSPFDLSDEDREYYRGFVLAARPNILEELSTAAIVKAQAGDFARALDIVNRLQGLCPGSPGVTLNKALILEEQAAALEKAGENLLSAAANEQALAAYKKILSLNPPMPSGLFNAGFFFMKLRNFEKTVECFSAYIKVADDAEKKARARKIVKEINSKNLYDDDFSEAGELIRIGREEEGIERARKFLEGHPGVWHGWFLLGWGLRRLKRWEDGAASFRKAIEFGGTNPDTRNELAICLMEMGELKEARKELEAALKNEPENIKIISNLGILALKNGNDDEAAAFFRAVLEIEPNDLIARNCLEQGGWAR